MRKKIKTLVYPFDDECEAFLEFHSWMEYIDIIAVDTPCGWGNMNFIEEGNIQQIGSNIKGIELLWIVESTNKITLNEFEKRLIFLTKDIKNILVSRKLSIRRNCKDKFCKNNRRKRYYRNFIGTKF